MSDNEFYDQQYFSQQLKVRNHPVRRFIRGFYLRKLAKLVGSPAVDFGCGTGALLEYLPKGSIGIEINPSAVAFCHQQGMDVRDIDVLTDPGQLDFMAGQGIRALVANHVLEHFDQPDQVLKLLLEAANRNHLNRVVVVVPGLAGFRSDATHRTFICRSYFDDNQLTEYAGFQLKKSYFFPLNFNWPGKWFRYHELHLLFERM